MSRKKRSTPDALWAEAGEAFRRGDLTGAETLCRALLAQNPRHAGAHHELGLIAYQRGQRTEAVPLLREALRLDPADDSAHFNLGVVLYELGQHSESAASHRAAIALNPGAAATWSSLSASLLAFGDDLGATDAARQAIALAPHLVAAAVNLSTALSRLGHEPEALETILVCVRRNPDSAEAWFWMGQTLHRRGEVTAALSAYERAIAIAPDYILAHARRAITWLSLGDFVRGWPEYEWRLLSPGANPRQLNQPRWSGESLADRTILVSGEQGLGDAIQMLRYVEPLAALAARVVVEVDSALIPLVPRLDNVDVVARGGAIPHFDVHCPLFSLPLAFGTTLESIPGLLPYVRPDAARVKVWEEIIAPAGMARAPQGRQRVGIAWSGSRGHQQDRDRSLPFEALAPLFALTGVELFSLQVGEAAGEAEASGVTSLGPLLRDFGETAAAMAHLDLVITVDTSVAHLAGALGVPVWVLLPFVADWRWMLDRDDSPWYPSARLFRQSALGDWGAVIDRVADGLG